MNLDDPKSPYPDDRATVTAKRRAVARDTVDAWIRLHFLMGWRVSLRGAVLLYRREIGRI